MSCGRESDVVGMGWHRSGILRCVVVAPLCRHLLLLRCDKDGHMGHMERAQRAISVESRVEQMLVWQREAYMKMWVWRSMV